MTNSIVQIPNFFTAEHRDRTFRFQVFNVCGNSCWGEVYVEDKLPPLLECGRDFIRCTESTEPEDIGFPIPEIFNWKATKIGKREYNVTGWDSCGDVNLYYWDSVEIYSCDNRITKEIFRKWNAIDESGNMAMCYDTISIFRPTIQQDVVWPPDYDGFDRQPLSCTKYLDSVPGPDELGYPVSAACITIQATYEDTRIDICPTSYKILRKWTVVDWCTNDIVEDYQVIKVLDDGPPEIVCPPDFTIGTDVWLCEGATFVEPPRVTRECGKTTYKVFYKTFGQGAPNRNGAIPAQLIGNKYFIENLPLGPNWIFYEVEDQCGNITECVTEVFVRDDTPPIPVCDEFTVVSLTIDGTGKVFAKTFEDEAYDNCELDFFEVRRMDTTCYPDATQFGPVVEFCCEDIGHRRMVELRVWDKAGNSNSCMVEVDVQDKLPPLIVCPPDVTVSCTFPFFFNDLSVFGKVVDDPNKREEIILEERYYPRNGLAGLDGYAVDNCSLTIEESFVDSMECGQGVIIRTFTATDAFGQQNSCEQRIHFRNPNPFTYEDIKWPDHVTIEGCVDIHTDPDSTGRPEFMNTACAQVASTYRDEVLTIVDSACYKILRYWTVLDWCQYSKTTGRGLYEWVQIIKVQNSTAPDLLNCDNLFFCDSAAYKDPISGICFGYARIIQEAQDDCTPEDKLVYSFIIDLHNDGTQDQFGFTNNASQHYPVGVHKIRWEVEDQCGNRNTCTYLFEVKDCKPPTPYCLNGITTVVMPSTGMITIWASDFDAGSFDNCTEKEDLIFSFSSDTSETSRTYDCDSMTTGNTLNKVVRVYVTDECGNQDYCETYIIIRDNDDSCPDTGNASVLVTGYIRTVDGEGVQANVSLKEAGTHAILQETQSGADGYYRFDNAPANTLYGIYPEKPDQAKRGVSTKDLVLVQQHLLGIRSFNSPLDYLAADVNGSYGISAKDLLEIRKVILGKKQSWTNMPEWLFIDAAYRFDDPTRPWAYPEGIEVNQVNFDLFNQNFKAIKLGDLDRSAKVNGGLFSRNSLETDWVITEHSFAAGEIIKVPVVVDQSQNMAGFQIQFEYDSDRLSFQGITSGMAELTESMYYHDRQHNTIRISFVQAEGLKVTSGEQLMFMEFRALEGGMLSSNLTLKDNDFAAEVYGNNEDYSIRLRWKNDGDEFVVHQNRPNPFSEETSIDFELPEDGAVHFTVFDMTGKLVTQKQMNLSAGTHKIEIQHYDLPQAGIYYYRLDSKDYSVTRKMIHVK